MIPKSGCRFSEKIMLQQDAADRNAVFAVAILSADPALRRRLERLQDDRAVAIVGVAGHSSDLLSLLGERAIDVAVIDCPTPAQLQQWKAARDRPPLVVLLPAGEEKNAAGALAAGATAVLDRSASRSKIIAAITTAAAGLVVLEPEHLAGLIGPAPPAAEQVADPRTGQAPLTARELDVLAAMADGASNKAIARRLGISFSTAKFHVASILTKLDADSRTEAVMKAAQAGLVML
jgi:DNA-binding NarL/FixJ family response regulator